jgi:hypothetical protein
MRQRRRRARVGPGRGHRGPTVPARPAGVEPTNGPGEVGPAVIASDRW